MRVFRSVLVSLAVGWAAVVSAEPSAKRAIDESHPGFELYRSYCAVCHGVFADGTGPAAPVLTEPPIDLTRLSDRYGTPLRSDELAEVIDGRTMARSHGTSEMPVWGARLYESTGGSQLLEKARRGTILRIIEYLGAIQQNADTASDDDPQ